MDEVLRESLEAARRTVAGPHQGAESAIAGFLDDLYHDPDGVRDMARKREQGATSCFRTTRRRETSADASSSRCRSTRWIPFSPQASILCSAYGPRAHVRPGRRRFLLAWMFRVLAPRPRERPLNILQRAELGLCQAGIHWATEVGARLAITDVFQDPWTRMVVSEGPQAVERDLDKSKAYPHLRWGFRGSPSTEYAHLVFTEAGPGPRATEPARAPQHAGSLRPGGVLSGFTLLRAIDRQDRPARNRAARRLPGHLSLRPRRERAGEPMKRVRSFRVWASPRLHPHPRAAAAHGPTPGG